MGADGDKDLPLLVPRLDARGIRLRIRQLCHVDVLGVLDLLLGAVIDEDRLAAPEHLDHLPFGNRRKIDFDGCASGNGRGIRIHLRNEWPQRASGAHGRNRAGRYEEKISPTGLGRRHRGHSVQPLKLTLWPPAAERLRKLDSLGRRNFLCPRHGDAAWRRRATLPLFPPRASASKRSSGRSGGDLLAPLPVERKWPGATSG